MKKVFLCIITLLLIFALISCTTTTTNKLLRVMVEDGDFFSVVGEHIKMVEYGSDVEFDIELQEGARYLGNNQGAIFEDGKLKLKDVKTNKIISLDVERINFTVTIHSSEYLSFLVNGVEEAHDQTFNIYYGSYLDIYLNMSHNKY